MGRAVAFTPPRKPRPAIPSAAGGVYSNKLCTAFAWYSRHCILNSTREVTTKKKTLGSTRKHRRGTAFWHVAVGGSHWVPKITTRACIEAIWPSKSLLEQASPYFDSTFAFVRRTPFKIALLRTVHCFEMCSVRLHEVW